MRSVKVVRRVLIVVSVASAATAALRSRRNSATSTPTPGGAWHELSGPDLR
ncbi:MAG TPA: hypothetical protein VNA57_04365 [Acidimicrobiales bacterium]|nr:hypothetical protein [Acidimicrobiales bacterium]